MSVSSDMAFVNRLLSQCRDQLENADAKDQGSPHIEGRLDALQKLNQAMSNLCMAVDVLRDRVQAIEERE